MSDVPKSMHEIKDFTGIDLSSGPVNLQPGESQDQVNIRSDQQGKMTVRRGVVATTAEASGTLY